MKPPRSENCDYFPDFLERKCVLEKLSLATLTFGRNRNDGGHGEHRGTQSSPAAADTLHSWLTVSANVRGTSYSAVCKLRRPLFVSCMVLGGRRGRERDGVMRLFGSFSSDRFLLPPPPGTGHRSAICDLHSAVGPALADLVLRCACGERPLPAAADPLGDVPGGAVSPRPGSKMRQMEQNPPPPSAVCRGYNVSVTLNWGRVVMQH